MSTDIISDVLRSVRLSGAAFFEIETTAPWAAEAPPAARVAEVVLPGSQHVMEYHVVAEGTCWAQVLGSAAPPVEIKSGSIVMFPRGDAHVLASAPHLPPVRDWSLYRTPMQGELLPYSVKWVGEGSAPARIICGFLGCDARPYNPLIESLPRLLHVADGFSSDKSWLGSLIRATVEESRHKRAGSSSVLARLSELLFIEAIRSYMETLPDHGSGWLTAVKDPHVGHAIRLFHAHPSKEWNLVSMAKEVGLSRTLLVERFSKQVGVGPMTYLQNWRMQLAAGKLATGTASIAQVAAEVGYESEAAFSRAFKRCAGVPPATWRHTTSAAQA